jgi:hypothetical protein
MLVATSTYIGSKTSVGVDFPSRSFSGLGFAPALMIYHVDFGVYIRAAGWSNTVRVSDGVLVTNAIISFDSDGWTIAGSTAPDVPFLDDNPVPYNWLALSADSALLASGEYTGDGVAGRLISTPFQPDFVFDARDGNNSFVWFQSKGGDNTAILVAAAGGFSPTHVTGVSASGFTVAGNLNVGGTTYRWFALKNGASNYQAGYVGTGAGHDISIPVPFTPVWLTIYPESDVEGLKQWSFKGAYDTATTMTSLNTTAGAVGSHGETNCVTAFGVGSFTLGTRALVNSNAIAYHYLAFGNPIPSAIASVTPSPQGGGGGAGVPDAGSYERWKSLMHASRQLSSLKVV